VMRSNFRFFSDIRFWIVLFFAVRLVGITNPPLETGHNWRQSLTCMVARNFLEIDNNILYPRIDMAGEKTGIIGSEFPFFNYLIYLISALFGYEHWYGRLINLIVSSLGIWYFYRLIKEFMDEKIAFHSTLILLTSIWFAFSRKIMPDTFSISLLLAGLYYGTLFLRSEKREVLHALLFGLLCTLGMLVKIPALSLFSGISIVAFLPNIPIRKKVQFFALAIFALIGVFAWYFVWVPHLLEAYQFQLYFPKGLIEGAREILPLLDLFAEKFYFAALHSFIALACAIAGLFWFVRLKSNSYILTLSIISLVFFLFILKTGSVFPLHNYYIIPFVPLMAFLAGFGLSKLNSHYRTICLVFLCFEGIANQQHDFFIRPEQTYKLGLEGLLKETLNNNEKIIINGGLSPQDMYFAHRRGWSLNAEDISEKSVIDSLYSLQARYVVIDRKHDVKLKFPALIENKSYRLYELNAD
jgi:hypothetical protein